MNKFLLFGWGYVIDTCISLFQKEQEDRAYRMYISECLRMAAENTARSAAAMSGEGSEVKYISVSFDELMHHKPEDDRTPEEIIANIREKLQNLGGE